MLHARSISIKRLIYSQEVGYGTWHGLLFDYTRKNGRALRVSLDEEESIFSLESLAGLAWTH